MERITKKDRMMAEWTRKNIKPGLYRTELEAMKRFLMNSKLLWIYKEIGLKRTIKFLINGNTDYHTETASLTDILRVVNSVYGILKHNRPLNVARVNIFPLYSVYGKDEEDIINTLHRFVGLIRKIHRGEYKGVKLTPHLYNTLLYTYENVSEAGTRKILVEYLLGSSTNDAEVLSIVKSGILNIIDPVVLKELLYKNKRTLFRLNAAVELINNDELYINNMEDVKKVVEMLPEVEELDGVSLERVSLDFMSKVHDKIKTYPGYKKKVLPILEPIKIGGYSIKELPVGSPLHLSVGVLVGSCQHLGGYASECAMHSLLNKRGTTWVVTRGKTMVAHAWVWMPKKADDVIVIDNIEAGIINGNRTAMDIVAKLYHKAIRQIIGRNDNNIKRVLVGTSYTKVPIGRFASAHKDNEYDAPTDYTDADKVWEFR